MSKEEGQGESACHVIDASPETFGLVQWSTVKSWVAGRQMQDEVEVDQAAALAAVPASGQPVASSAAAFVGGPAG